MDDRKKRNSRMQLRRQKKKRVITAIRYTIGLILLAVIVYMAYGMYQEIRVRTVEEGSVQYTENEKQGKQPEVTTKKVEVEIVVPTEPVHEKYLGYQVDSRLEIPKINLKTNVLKDYSKKGLKVCASKYYGPEPNEIGNYCIAGHNYNKENMFHHLIDLRIGDCVFLTDNKKGIVEYVIYDIYKVKPQNIEPLSQETRGEKEITLITCVNYSRNRLVVKAIEKHQLKK